jgi:hypothetical protein
MKETKKTPEHLEKENQKVLSTIGWTLYVMSYQIVLNNLVSIIGTVLNSPEQPTPALQGETPPKVLNQEEVPPPQSWTSWGIGGVSYLATSVAVFAANRTETGRDLVKAYEGIDIAREIASDEKRRESFLRDPATIAFLSDKKNKDAPRKFFDAAKKAGVIDDLVSSHEAGTTKNIAGQLLQDPHLSDKIFTLIEALGDQEIQDFVSMYYEKDRVKIAAQILRNNNLQTAVKDALSALPEHTPTLIQLGKLFLTKEQQKSLDSSQAQKAIKEALLATQSFKKEHFQAISNIISSEPITNILKAKKGEHAKIVIEEIPKFIAAVQQDAKLASSLKDLREFVASKAPLIKQFVPEEFKKYLDLITNPQLSITLANLLSNIDSKNIEKIIDIYDSEDKAKTASELLTNPAFQQFILANKDKILQLASYFIDQENQSLQSGIEIAKNLTKEDFSLISAMISSDPKILSSDPKIRAETITEKLPKIITQNSAALCAFLERHKKDIVNIALNAAVPTLEERPTGQALEAVSSIIQSVIRSPNLSELLKHQNGLKDPDPKEIEKHSSAFVQNLVQIFTQIDFTKAKEIYKDPSKIYERKQLNAILQNIGESWGLKINVEQAAKFAISNQDNIKKLIENKETGFLAKIKSVKILALMVVKNPTIVKIWYNNKKIISAYKEPFYKTEKLQEWIKSSITRSQENSQEFGNAAVELAEKSDKELVRFYGGNTSGLDLRKMELAADIDFSNIKIDRVFFTESKISSDFKNATISSCSFAGCELSGSFEGATLNNVSFEGAKLSQEVVKSLSHSNTKMDHNTRASFDAAKLQKQSPDTKKQREIVGGHTSKLSSTSKKLVRNQEV